MCENKQDPQKSQVNNPASNQISNPVSKFNLKIDVDLANSQNKAKLSSMTYEGSDKIMAFSGEKVTYEVIKYFNFRTCLCKTNIDDRCYVLKIGDYKKDTPIKERLLAQLLSQGRCILPDPTPLMLAEDALISVNKTDQTTTVFGNPAKMVKLAGVSSKDETVKVYKLPETEDMNSLSKCCGCFGDRSSVKPALESKAQDVSTPHREIMIDMSDFPDSVTKKRKIEETEQNTDLKSDPTTNTGRCSGTLYSTTPGTLTVTTDEFDSSFVPIFFDSFVDFIAMNRRQRQGVSRYVAFHKSFDDEICIALDGDDWLFNEFVLSNLEHHYVSKDLLVSYGSYYTYDSTSVPQGKAMGVPYNKKLIGASQIPEDVKKAKSFRNAPWMSVHLRSAYAKLFKMIELRHYIDHEGTFFKMCTDQSEMFPVLEMSQMRNSNIGKPMLVYNKHNSELYATSYYRINEAENKANVVYREVVTKLIKSRPYYPKVNGSITLETVNPLVNVMSLKNTKEMTNVQFCDVLKADTSDYVVLMDDSSQGGEVGVEITDLISQYYRSKPGALLFETISTSDHTKATLELFKESDLNSSLNSSNTRPMFAIKMFADRFCVVGKDDQGKAIKVVDLTKLVPGVYNREKLINMLSLDQKAMNEVYLQRMTQ